MLGRMFWSCGLLHDNDVVCWGSMLIMLDLCLNEVIMKYMKFNLGICVKSMIYDEFIWWAWEYDINIPAVHV